MAEESGQKSTPSDNDSMGVDRTIDRDTAIITAFCIIAAIVLAVARLWGQF